MCTPAPLARVSWAPAAVQRPEPRACALTCRRRRFHGPRRVAATAAHTHASSARDYVTDDVLENYLNRQVDLKIYGLQPKFRVGQAHPSVNGDVIPRINTGVRVYIPASTPRSRQRSSSGGCSR